MTVLKNDNIAQLSYFIILLGLVDAKNCLFKDVKDYIPKCSMQKNKQIILRGRWILPNKTITYDSLPLSHGLGSFDMASGEWTAEVNTFLYILSRQSLIVEGRG